MNKTFFTVLIVLFFVGILSAFATIRTFDNIDGYGKNQTNFTLISATYLSGDGSNISGVTGNADGVGLRDSRGQYLYDNGSMVFFNETLLNTTISALDTDTNTNANTICSGTTTYLDGDGNCDDLGESFSMNNGFIISTPNSSCTVLNQSDVLFMLGTGC